MLRTASFKYRFANRRIPTPIIHLRMSAFGRVLPRVRCGKVIHKHDPERSSIRLDYVTCPRCLARGK